MEKIVIKKGVNCVYFTEEGRLLFSECSGKLDAGMTISDRRRTEGVFLNRDILSQIKKQAKSKSNTLAKYYGYQKELLAKYNRLKELVESGHTIYWRRRAPLHDMELLAIKHRA